MRSWVDFEGISHAGSFLLFAKQAQCEDFALTIAAFSGVTHLFLEPPTDVETRNEYEKTMGELIVEPRGGDDVGRAWRPVHLLEALRHAGQPARNGRRRDCASGAAGSDRWRRNAFLSGILPESAGGEKGTGIACSVQVFLGVGGLVRVEYSLIPRDAVEALGEKGEEEDKEMAIMHCLIKAYFKNICKLSSNGCYVPVNLLNEEGSNEGDISVFLHEDSVLHMINTVHHWVLFKDIQLTDAIYIRDVVEVNPLEVARTIPRFYKWETECKCHLDPSPEWMPTRNPCPVLNCLLGRRPWVHSSLPSPEHRSRPFPWRVLAWRIDSKTSSASRVFVTNRGFTLDSVTKQLLQLSKRIVCLLSALLRVHEATQDGSSDSTEPAVGLLVSKIQSPAQPLAFLRNDNARILLVSPSR